MLNYRYYSSLCDPEKQKAKTRSPNTQMTVQVYNGLPLSYIYPLIDVLSNISDFYQRLGLSINIGKTEFMQYSSDQDSARLHIDGNHLN